MPPLTRLLPPDSVSHPRFAKPVSPLRLALTLGHVEAAQVLIDAGADAVLALSDALQCNYREELLPKEQWAQLCIKTSDAMRATIVELINVAGARISAVVAFEVGVVSCDFGIVARFGQPAFAEYDLDRGGERHSLWRSWRWLVI